MRALMRKKRTTRTNPPSIFKSPCRGGFLLGRGDFLISESLLQCPIIPPKTKKCRRFLCGVRGSNRIRTYDTSGMNRMLWPAELLSQMVAGVGLEPTTSGL